LDNINNPRCLKGGVNVKKRILTTLALMLCALLVLAACNGNGNGNGGQATAPATGAEPAAGADENGDDGWEQAPLTRLIMVTGGTGGIYYPFGGVLAGVVNARTNLQITPNASEASVDNLGQLASGDAHVAIAQNDVMSYAFYGTGFWADAGRAPVPTLATLMTLYPEVLQVVVAGDSGIYSVADLAGRLVSIGGPGSGVEANALQVLAAYGLTRDDIDAVQLGFAPSADAMRDGNLDAFFVTSAAPNTAVFDLSRARDLRIIPLSEAAMTSLLGTYDFYVRVSLTADDYEFLTEPVQTLAVQATLVATVDMDEQVAYDIVRAIFEGREDVIMGHARGEYISAENAVASLSVPLHPGAERFFREIGAIN